MKRVFADTNVVLDLLMKRDPYWHEAARLFSEAEKGNLTIIVSALSVSHITYILRKHVSIEVVRKSILELFKLVTVACVDKEIVESAIADDQFSDIEDAFQHYTALASQAEAIITRNVRDFAKSTIPVMTPSEYLLLNIR